MADLPGWAARGAGGMYAESVYTGSMYAVRRRHRVSGACTCTDMPVSAQIVLLKGWSSIQAPLPALTVVVSMATVETLRHQR